MRVAVRILWLAASIGAFAYGDALGLPEQRTSTIAPPSRQKDSTAQPANPVYESAALVLCGGFLLVVARKFRKAFPSTSSDPVPAKSQAKTRSTRRAISMSHTPDECFAVSQASSLES